MAVKNFTSVSPKDAVKYALALTKFKKIPFFFHGKPGVGKSDIVKQVADSLGMKLEVVMLTQIEAQDLRGLSFPDADSKRTTHYIPEFLPTEDSPPTVVFLDELTGAEQRLQVAAYQLLLSGRLGNYVLPSHSYVCAAGNDITDGAVAYEMGTALASRLMHFNIQAEPRSFLEWGANAGVHPDVLTLINVKGDLLEQNEKQVEANHMVGPNPRNWERVSSILNEFGSLKNRAFVEPMVDGLVGKAACADLFLTAEEMSGLPPTAELFSDMNDGEFKAKVVSNIKSISSLYGISNSMLAYVNNADTANKMSEVFNRLTASQDLNRLGLPVREIQTYAMEMLMLRAVTLNVFDNLLQSSDFREYMKTAKDATSVGSNTASGNVQASARSKKGK